MDYICGVFLDINNIICSVCEFFLKIYLYILDRAIGLMGTVFASGPGDQGWIPGRVIPKTQK